MLAGTLGKQAKAQFTLSAQLRTRSELRDGQGAPLPKDAKAAFFTSQRTRLIAGYNWYRIKMGITVQDVRVWGQDVSSLNRTTTQDNNGIMLHEAWAEIGLSDTGAHKTNVGLKIGRQQLAYDDQRLLGGLDWLQQGRRHDAAVLKIESSKFALHTGFAFNQNKEAASGTKYNGTPAGAYPGNSNGGTHYKGLEYLHAQRKLKSGSVSFLFLADQFNKYHNDVINNVTTKVWDNGSWTRATTGLHATNSFKKLNLTASAYYQFGKNYNGSEMSGALLSVVGLYNFSKNFTAGAGYDYTTGGAKDGKNNAFDPLYGTPHKFWGLMDYFYVASGFGNKGLSNIYLKSKLKAGKSLVVALDVHKFASATDITDASGKKLNRNFGTEADLVLNYPLTKYIGFEAGYSHFWSTATLTAPSVKNVANAQSNNNWAYLQINITPDLFSVK